MNLLFLAMACLYYQGVLKYMTKESVRAFASAVCPCSCRTETAGGVGHSVHSAGLPALCPPAGWHDCVRHISAAQQSSKVQERGPSRRVTIKTFSAANF